MDTNFKVLMTLMGLEIGGAETHVLELCKALAKRGVSVYVASNGGAYEEELAQCGIVHFHVPLHNKKLHNVFKAYYTLEKIIIDNDIKLVHAHARIPAFLCGLLKKRLDIRFVTTAHGVFTTMFPFNVLTNWGERTLAVSEDIKQYLMDNYKVKAERIAVTVNGINTDKFSSEADYSGIAKEFELQNDAVRIVYISRLDKRVSLIAHQLIEAASELYAHEKQLEIVMVGGGNDFKNIKNKADAFNKKHDKEIIKLTGARVDAEKFVASADVFVGVSRAALEAMSASKPVVIAGNEGYIGIFDEDKIDVAIGTNFCCRGCELSSPTLLSKDLLTLLKTSSEEKKRLGDFGRETIKKNYSVEKMGEDALELYESVRYKTNPIDVMISGYYGFNNNGDDTVLSAIVGNLRELKPNINIMVLSKQPKDTQTKYNVLAINRFNFFAINKHLKQTTLLISGGGSLIQDLTSTHSLMYYLFVINCAIRNKARVMLYSNGIGPLNNGRNKKLVSKILNRVDLITLRDEQSQEVLSELSIDKPQILVTVDATFSINKEHSSNKSEFVQTITNDYAQKYFIIAIRKFKYLKDNFEQEIATFADEVFAKYGFLPVFVAMQPTLDTEISRKAMSLMKNKSVLFDTNNETEQLIDVIEKAEFVLAMRLHTLIYAIQTATPIIGLIYDPKVKAVMDSINQKSYVYVSDVNCKILEGFAEEVIINRLEISEQIRGQQEGFKQKAQQNAILAVELLQIKEF